MELRAEFYLHITGGLAGEAAPLIARIALHVGHDAKAYPVSLAEILRIGEAARDFQACGFNELLVADYLRSAMLGGSVGWDATEVQELKRVAGAAPLGALHLIPGGRLG